MCFWFFSPWKKEKSNKTKYTILLFFFFLFFFFSSTSIWLTSDVSMHSRNCRWSILKKKGGGPARNGTHLHPAARAASFTRYLASAFVASCRCCVSSHPTITTTTTSLFFGLRSKHRLLVGRKGNHKLSSEKKKKSLDFGCLDLSCDCT